MSQTSVLSREYTFKGGTIADMSACDVISRSNSTRQRDTITINSNTAICSVVINSATYSANAASAVSTIAAVTNELAYAIEAGEEDLKIVSVTSAVITLESKSGAAVSIASADTATTTASVVAYTNSEIAFGTFVEADAYNYNAAKLPAGTATFTLGCAVEAVTENASGSTGTGYATDATMDIVCKGVVWARKQSDAVFAPGSAVYVRQTAGGSSLALGILNDDADTATCTLLSNVRVEKSAAAGDTYVKVRINMP